MSSPTIAELEESQDRLLETLKTFSSMVWSDCRLPGDLRRDLEAYYHNEVVSTIRSVEASRKEASPGAHQSSTSQRSRP